MLRSLQSTVYKVSIGLPFEKKGHNYGSLPRSWVQYNLLKIASHKQATGAGFKKKEVTRKVQTVFCATLILRPYKSEDYERKLTVCEVNCVWYFVLVFL